MTGVQTCALPILTHHRALSLGTIEGARSLGLGEVTGSLTPGKRADVICVAISEPNLGVLTDPAHMLVTAAQPANLDTVIVDGRVLKRADIICVAAGEPNLGVLTDPAHLLVTAAQPANVDTVIADGRVLKRGGALTAIDLPQVRDDARRALAGVLARAA